MLGYITTVLQRFLYPVPAHPEFSPCPWTHPYYSVKIYLGPVCDTSAKLTSVDTLHLQEVLYTLIYDTGALDATLLTAISDLLTE
jgi:hypothetical protein